MGPWVTETAGGAAPGGVQGDLATPRLVVLATSRAMANGPDDGQALVGRGEPTRPSPPWQEGGAGPYNPLGSTVQLTIGGAIRCSEGSGAVPSGDMPQPWLTG